MFNNLIYFSNYQKKTSKNKNWNTVECTDRWAMGIEDILFLKWKPNKIFILLSEFIFWPGLICGFADRESGDLNLKLISNF